MSVRNLIEAHRYDSARMQRFGAWAGKCAPWLSGDIDTPECYASFEEFRPDEPAGDWFYWYDEVDYAVSGACQAFFRSPPNFDVEHRLHLEAGDLFFIRVGTVARFEVIGDEPFVHIIVQMPRPPYTAEEGRPSFTAAESRD
ncbi:MAG: cupin domain-containing protein [bacterium]|nr:cupin domain-containing protein [bacterium]MDE0242503.1 cupin domain-containing protein [bacterium]